MMYNRYVPDAEGVYHASRVETPQAEPPHAPELATPPPAPPHEPVCEAAPPPAPPKEGFLRRLLPRSVDTGDLLLLLILLLLAVDAEEEDGLSGLLTAAAFLLF